MLTCVAATNLLHELRRNTQHHPAEMLRLAASEQGREWRVAAAVARGADAVVDNVGLQLDFLRLAMLATERREDGDGLLVTLAGQQPTRRFRL